MSKKTTQDILSHPDREEIFSKILLDLPSEDIHSWLKNKYQNINERRFIISSKNIEGFREAYLDIYAYLREDVLKIKESKGTSKSLDEEIELSVKGNPTYQERINSLLDQEIDLKKTIKKLIIAIEARAEQIFDQIQNDPQGTKKDYVLIQWFNTLTNAVEKLDKITNGSPDQIIQHNISIQMVDQQIGFIQDAIRAIIAEFDYETSMKFLDLFNDKMKKIRENSPEMLSIEQRTINTHILSQNILNKDGS